MKFLNISFLLFLVARLFYADCFLILGENATLGSNEGLFSQEGSHPLEAAGASKNSSVGGGDMIGPKTTTSITADVSAKANLTLVSKGTESILTSIMNRIYNIAEALDGKWSPKELDVDGIPVNSMNDTQKNLLEKGTNATSTAKEEMSETARNFYGFLIMILISLLFSVYLIISTFCGQCSRWTTIRIASAMSNNLRRRLNIFLRNHNQREIPCPRSH